MQGYLVCLVDDTGTSRLYTSSFTNKASLVTGYATKSLWYLSCFPFNAFKKFYVYLEFRAPLLISILQPSNIGFIDFAENFHWHCMKRSLYDIDKGIGFIDYCFIVDMLFPFWIECNINSKIFLKCWLRLRRFYLSCKWRCRMLHFVALNLIILSLVCDLDVPEVV